ncbi:AAA family ATPase [Fournierella sp.]|uniref:ParA family protein n=1 Tax=Allofournierella sp. TaxID=1940256 RepID=UPI00307954E2
MKIVSIANQKGGVGKSTTVINMAAALVKRGKSVLCIDFDPQGHLSTFMGWEGDTPTTGDLMQSMANSGRLSEDQLSMAICHHEEGMDYIAANVTLAAADIYLVTTMYREQVLQRILQQLPTEHYDYVLIDCPPSLGLLLTNALVVSSEVIIPVQAQMAALMGLEMLQQAIENVANVTGGQLRINGILPTMVDRTNQSAAVCEALRSDYPGLTYNTEISRLIEAADSTATGHSCLALRRSVIGSQYTAMVDEFLNREEK